MKTVYYTENFDKWLKETDNIIYLNINDLISLNHQSYKIVWKLFNATDNIMVYHCKIL